MPGHDALRVNFRTSQPGLATVLEFQAACYFLAHHAVRLNSIEAMRCGRAFVNTLISVPWRMK